MSNVNNIAPINEDFNIVKYEIDDIKQRIYTIRGKQVILDSDIAALYEVENLRSQFATSSLNKNNYGGRRYLPYAFPEQGVAMLSAVLHSDKAIQVSINIIKAFTEMRKFILNNQMLFEKISSIELKQIEYQKSTDDRFKKVFEYIGEHKEKEQKVFFEGQVYDAFSMIVDLIHKAKEEIILIDNYVDIDTLNILSKLEDNTEG